MKGKICKRALIYASRRGQKAIVIVMMVAPTKIPITGTSGYRNAKLETHHLQSFASCRSLPTPLQVAGCNMSILLVASTSPSANSRPKQKDLVSQPHKARGA